MTIIKKFELEIEKKTYPKKYIGLVIISLFVLILAEIWASNQMADYGGKLEKLTQLKHTLNLENQVLENEIAKSQALINVASKSAELGFGASESIQYIR